MSVGSAEDGFAGLLRELKDRSGLSYGALARRLHMSTSTLHRYCNGDAVPTDYAPVERFARLCRASPQELVELHRRWVLADAMRGSGGAKKAQEGSVEGSVEGAVEAPVVGPAEGSAVEPVGGSVDGPVDGSVDGPVEQSVEEVVERGVGEVAGGGELPGAPRSLSVGPVRRLRRRTGVLAGVAVAAVLATVALVVGLPSPDTGLDGREGAVGAAAPDDSASGTPSGPAASSPVPSASVSPSGSSAAVSGSPSASPSVPSGGRAPATAEGSAPPPLTVHTRPYAWEGPCSQHYLIDRGPADVGPPPVEQDAPAWVGAYKAVSAGEQLLRLTVQGTGARTVVVEGLQVRVVERGTPLAWNDYVMGVGCGGRVPTRPFTVALDGARPEVVAGAGQPDFPFKVSESDPEVFEVTADASAYDVTWYLELHWSSGDREGTVVVDDSGRPFRTSGNNGRPGYQFPVGAEGWGDAQDGTEGDPEGGP
ncbi:helix-turn-helix transcriptional regulator [Streptomyces sp. NPDC048290]|uniref:helix-turn-helix domain-containing protein n=1 Tax=Streptomyces sp. NPDC048290 TaxID=3155811 RepID=UPI003436C235